MKKITVTGIVIADLKNKYW